MSDLMTRICPDIVAEVGGSGSPVGLGVPRNDRTSMAKARERHLVVSGSGEDRIRLPRSLMIPQAEADDIADRLACTAETMRTDASHEDLP